MKKAMNFLSNHRKKVLGLGVYYVLYAALLALGTARGWPLALLSAFLLLILLVAAVGGGGNHYADLNAFEQQPLVAQDLPPAPREIRGLMLPMAVLLVWPPVLYLAAVLL